VETAVAVFVDETVAFAEGEADAACVAVGHPCVGVPIVGDCIGAPEALSETTFTT
jgi:hypothetical protein